jgi:hypothetical protein
MYKVQIAGDSIVVTSSMKLEELQLIEKNRPEALKLREEDGKMIFVVSVGTPSINPKNSITFASESHDGTGLASVTLKIPEGTKDAKEYIVDNYSGALDMLKKIEDKLPAVIRELNTARDTLRDSIVTISSPNPAASDDDE